MRRIFSYFVIASFALCAIDCSAIAGIWDAVRMVKCANAKWTVAPEWAVVPESDVWNVVGDQADLIGIDHVCKARLIWEECRTHPNMTVGQALASIYYKIEFGRKLPSFQCGA
jgi:hypothetical protein